MAPFSGPAETECCAEPANHGGAGGLHVLCIFVQHRGSLRVHQPHDGGTRSIGPRLCISATPGLEQGRRVEQLEALHDAYAGSLILIQR
jgi:hypothetical protein